MNTVIPTLQKTQERVSKEINSPDKINQALLELRREVYKDPQQYGNADALLFMGTMYRELGFYHEYEVLSLMAQRLSFTFTSENKKTSKLYTWINLCNACVFQKSFDEAYYYGKVAEDIFNSEDEDFLSNMVICCWMTGKKEEASNYDSKLNKINHLKAIEVRSILAGDSPTISIFQKGDCSDLYNKLLEARDNPQKTVEIIRKVIIDIAQNPDGKKCWLVWRLLAEYYVSQSQQPNEMEFIENYARAAAAAGKAIAFAPVDELMDPKFFLWFGQALGQMTLYKRAIYALEKALMYASNGEGPMLTYAIKDSLQYCREMYNKYGI